jgi:hypothetical protein
VVEIAPVSSSNSFSPESTGIPSSSSLGVAPSPTSPSAPTPTFSKPSPWKKFLTPKVILGAVVGLLLLTGLVSAAVLTQLNQDVRQQASSNYDKQTFHCCVNGQDLDISATECVGRGGQPATNSCTEQIVALTTAEQKCLDTYQGNRTAWEVAQRACQSKGETWNMNACACNDRVGPTTRCCVGTSEIGVGMETSTCAEAEGRTIPFSSSCAEPTQTGTTGTYCCVGTQEVGRNMPPAECNAVQGRTQAMSCSSTAQQVMCEGTGGLFSGQETQPSDTHRCYVRSNDTGELYPYYQCNEGFSNQGGRCVLTVTLENSCGTGIGLFMNIAGHTTQPANSSPCIWDRQDYYKCDQGYQNYKNRCATQAEIAAELLAEQAAVDCQRERGASYGSVTAQCNLRGGTWDNSSCECNEPVGAQQSCLAQLGFQAYDNLTTACNRSGYIWNEQSCSCMHTSIQLSCADIYGSQEAYEDQVSYCAPRGTWLESTCECQVVTETNLPSCQSLFPTRDAYEDMVDACRPNQWMYLSWNEQSCTCENLVAASASLALNLNQDPSCTNLGNIVDWGTGTSTGNGFSCRYNNSSYYQCNETFVAQSGRCVCPNGTENRDGRCMNIQTQTSGLGNGTALWCYNPDNFCAQYLSANVGYCTPFPGSSSVGFRDYSACNALFGAAPPITEMTGTTTFEDFVIEGL